jgi:molybdopterin-guanine dinucleotide biosynthesis protein A/thiamine kinase-like enzyme
MKFNVIIPMAGEGSRFGYTFKPLLKLDDRTFIEHVIEPFLEFDHLIETYNFIITQEQETSCNASATLHSLLIYISKKINIHIIESKTDGPYQTLLAFMKDVELKHIVICDCDHKINIQPIIHAALHETPTDVIIPLWEIKNDEQHNWGKLVMKDDDIIDYYEKEVIQIHSDERMYGMIGCYYFRTTKLFPVSNYLNISDFLKYFKLPNIRTVKVKEALFFGTPDMVNDAIEKRRSYENIICDIDGVIIQHSPNSNTKVEDNELIKGCASKILEWKSQNKKIILMTARAKTTRQDFIILLDKKGIIWDELIMGVNPGTRYVINDIKPAHIFTKQAISINVIRNEGIDNVICNENKNNSIKIVRVFKGGSFSKTYLLENHGIKFVRKHIFKNQQTLEHYYRLKRQCDDLYRFHYYDNELVPKVIHEQDSDCDYFYDMDYLENYEQLDCFDAETQKKSIEIILERMNTNVYCFKKFLRNDSFIYDFFNEKIYPKLIKFEKDSEVMNYLICNPTVNINGKSYYGLRTIFDKLDIRKFNPSFICPIHGDLNFENILYNPITGDVKTLDMEGSRYVDSPLFDLGKLFQSFVAKYEVWSKMDEVVYNSSMDNLTCVSDFFDYNKADIVFVLDMFKTILENDDEDQVLRSGLFYMACYFIRFIPFRALVSENHANFSMIMAIVWLNKIYEE